jgi:glycosyltransferase involved in cell wall biosynthesis
VRLLFVGRLVGQKGPATALEALALLRWKRPELDARLCLVGEGPEEVRLRTLARQLGVAERIELAGGLPHNRVAERMQEADLLLVPSRPSPAGGVEAFGRVVIESQASGVPVAASPVGGLPESVGVGGVLATDLTAAGLVAAVESILATAGPSDWALRTRQHAEGFGLGKMRDAYAEVTDAAIAAAI